MRGLAVRDERDFLSEFAGPAPECLTPQELEAVAAGSAPAERKSHLDACLYCQTELELLTGFVAAEARSGQESAAVNHIVNRLKAEPRWRPDVAAAKAGAEAADSGSWWSRLFASPMRGFAVAGLAAALAVGVWFGGLRSVETPRRDSGFGADVVRSAGRIEVISPVGDLTAPPAELHWQPAAGAVAYQVRLLEVDGAEVWQGRVTGPQAAVPAATQALMLPQKTLFWTVSGLDAQGKEIASSGRERFRVTRIGQ